MEESTQWNLLTRKSNVPSAEQSSPLQQANRNSIMKRAFRTSRKDVRIVARPGRRANAAEADHQSFIL